MKRLLEINSILGAWLILAPFVLAYSSGHTIAVSNDIVIGVLLVGCSLWAMTAEARRLFLAVFEGLCGAWLIAAPFVLHERALSSAFANNVAVGSIVLLVSLVEGWMLSGRPYRAA
jgi:hypothetical protein